MTFDYPGYELIFKQQRPCTDETAHLFSRIYTFFSPKTGLKYILTAEYHDCEVFGIKFYAKKDRHSDFRYSRIINKGDLGNILITCAKVVPLLLREYPSASFGFIGARTYDNRSKTLESIIRNQRFNTYSYIVKQIIGTQTFTHFEYPNISGYLLVNNGCGNVALREKEIIEMLASTYQYVPDVAPIDSR